MWHYVQSELNLWTVGYGEGKTWTPDSDHDSRGSAAARVAYLNGQAAADAELLAWAKAAYKFISGDTGGFSGADRLYMLKTTAPDAVR